MVCNPFTANLTQSLQSRPGHCSLFTHTHTTAPPHTYTHTHRHASVNTTKVLIPLHLYIHSDLGGELKINIFNRIYVLARTAALLRRAVIFCTFFQPVFCCVIRSKVNFSIHRQRMLSGRANADYLTMPKLVVYEFLYVDLMQMLHFFADKRLFFILLS